MSASDSKQLGTNRVSSGDQSQDTTNVAQPISLSSGPGGQRWEHSPAYVCPSQSGPRMGAANWN